MSDHIAKVGKMVPAEWATLMVAASMEYQSRRLGLPGNLWATYKTEEGDRIATEAMAHALAAVAPLIAKAERERCAVIAENHEWFVGGIGTTAPGSGQAKAIAAAIRALT